MYLYKPVLKIALAALNSIEHESVELFHCAYNEISETDKKRISIYVPLMENEKDMH